MATEQILFHKGLNGEARSCLTTPGFLKTAENVSFKVDGVQTLRPSFRPLHTLSGVIHSIRSFEGIAFSGIGGALYGGTTSLYSSFASTAWIWDRFKDFLVGVNGTDFVLVDADKNVHNARIPNPTTACAGAAGAAGNPSGHYMLYVSYLITFPNGMTYETGLSPASTDVNVTTQAISWSAIPVCPTTTLYGTALSIQRNLYRGPGTGGTIANIYYVDTIADNTTTTYTDDLSDVDLAANDPCYVEDYTSPPIAKFVVFHYGRCFMIPYTNVHRLWYSEAPSSLDALENETLIPLAVTDLNWDDIRTSGLQDVDPQALVSWGVNLYIALKQTWIRKQGNDPDTWGYKKTYATHGIGAPRSVCVCGAPLGILGITNPEFGEPGLALFTGQESQIISSPRLDFIFHDDLDHDLIAECVGKVIGSYYHLVYPSIDGTYKYVVIDLTRFPDIRVAYWTDLGARTLDGDSQTTKMYIGGDDGVVRYNASGESIDVVIETNDLIGGDKAGANVHKTYKEMRYALNGTLVMEVYIDDVLMKWSDGTTSKTLTGTDETLQWIQSLPQDWQGYRFRIKLTGTGLSELELFSPWSVDFDIST